MLAAKACGPNRIRKLILEGRNVRYPTWKQAALKAARQAAIARAQPRRKRPLHAEGLRPGRYPLQRALSQLPRPGPAYLNPAMVAGL